MWTRVTPRTRLIVVSHVTSPTAIIVPIAEICRRARAAGIAVCVDGPHAPAMIPIDLTSLDCDYYTASCHKWLSAPFGSGFLYVHPRAQSGVRPAIVSWGRTPAGEAPSWRDEFHWTGTRDPAAVLSIPAAIDFFESLGPAEFRRRTHALARHLREQITSLTGLPPLTPDSEACYASMVAVPLPAGAAQPLQDAPVAQSPDRSPDHRLERPPPDPRLLPRLHDNRPHRPAGGGAIVAGTLRVS